MATRKVNGGDSLEVTQVAEQSARPTRRNSRIRSLSHASPQLLKFICVYPIMTWQGITLRVEGRVLIFRLVFFMGCSWLNAANAAVVRYCCAAQSELRCQSGCLFALRFD